MFIIGLQERTTAFQRLFQESSLHVDPPTFHVEQNPRKGILNAGLMDLPSDSRESLKYEDHASSGSKLGRFRCEKHTRRQAALRHVSDDTYLQLRNESICSPRCNDIPDMRCEFAHTDLYLGCDPAEGKVMSECRVWMRGTSSDYQFAFHSFRIVCTSHIFHWLQTEGSSTLSRLRRCRSHE